MKLLNRSRKLSRPRLRGQRRRSGGSARRAVSSAAWPARRAAWAIEERVVWAGADAARAAVGDATWPLERLIWSVRRHAIWPVRDWFGAWGLVARSAFVISLLWIGAVACLTGARVANQDVPGARPEPVAATGGHQVAVKLGAAPVVKQGAVLHGATPSFAPPEQEAEGAAASAGQPAATAAATDAATTTSTIDATSAPAEAPPAALRVARRFAEAFVVYEVGNAGPDVRLAFRETATVPVVRALAERPPRQPAGVDVPEARVLNVVSGPRHGPNLSVSVSLLRLDTTTELRLQMERTSDGWLVSDVRG
jgi:hypothetical protein